MTARRCSNPAIDQLIASRATPLRVVLPAGNHYLARCHATFSMAAAQPLVRPVEVAAVASAARRPIGELRRDLAAALADGPQALPQVEVRVTTPAGATSPWIGPGADWSWPSPTNVRFYATYIDAFPPGSRPHILLCDGADRCS